MGKKRLLRIFDNPFTRHLIHKSSLLRLTVLDYLPKLNKGPELVSTPHFQHDFSVKEFPR